MQIPRWRKRLVRPGCAHEADSGQSRGGASAHREGEGCRLEHQSAQRAVLCIGLRCLGQERLARPTIRTCPQLAHGRWAGDRVGRSAREAGASLKTLSKRATLTEQQRHRLGSGSFEWRPETAESAWWTVLDCLPKRSSPEWGAACQNRGAARLCTARAGHEAALRKEAPRGAEGGCLQAIPWSLGPLRAECCRRLRRRRRPARHRHRRLRHRRLCRHDRRNS